MSTSTACPDWKQRLVDRRSLVPRLDLNTSEADRAARIFNRLRLPDVIGQPTIGESVGDWYRDAVRALFGSYDVATHARRIATVHMILPKKQGKTTLSAGTMLTSLMMNRRPNARFGILGSTQKISGEAYDAAAGMVDADKKLQHFLKTTDHTKTIEHRLTGAYLEITSFDLKVATGGKFAGCLVDELHVLGSMAKADRVVGQIRGARVALPESFIWFITTQSEEAPCGIFKKELDYARGVRDGEIDDKTYLPVIYEFPKEVQADKGRPWENPDIWYQVMPSLGVAVQRDVLEEQFRAVKIKGEADLRTWASQHLNIEIGLALGSDGWAGADFWEDAAEPAVTLERIIQCCDAIEIGIDGGGSDDLASLYVIGREDTPDKDIGHRRWFGWGHSWAYDEPVNGRGVLQRRKSEASKLLDFAEAGELTIFTKPGDDVVGMVDIIRKVYESGKLCHVSVDDYAKIQSELSSALIDAEIVEGDGEEPLLVFVRQGRALQDAAGALERRLMNGLFIHADQAVVSYAVGNAKVETWGNAEVITKASSGKAKIDPLMAALNAAHHMSRNPQPRGTVMPADYELPVWA